jgi:hypothetical protein
VKRKRLVEKTRGARLITDEAGPITQGLRLSTPWGMVVVNFNGVLGLAVANYGSNNVLVLLDRCVPPRRRAARH